MAAYQAQNKKVSSCKCGPDYIDPMFHKEVLGVDSKNLDLFFSSEDELRKEYAKHAADAELVITEGVMGYYDGMRLDSVTASSYDVARTLDIPAVLILPCKGAALSLCAVVSGIVSFQKDSNIQGIILNRVSKMLYPRLKKMLEDHLKSEGYDIPVLGYIPQDEAFCLESRHLGLVTPQEICHLKEQMTKAGNIVTETVDLDRLYQIAQGEQKANSPEKGQIKQNMRNGQSREPFQCDMEKYKSSDDGKVRVGVAKDAAFCFYYKENLELLEESGAELVFFSPLRDQKIPENISGLIFGGGYPELNCKELSENNSMRRSVKDAIRSGMPCLAECGGFMYLHEEMEDERHIVWEMAGVLNGRTYPAGKLVRFGYVELSHEKEQKESCYLKQGEVIKGHEFHYWDSSDNGEGLTAAKPDRRTSWKCVHTEGSLFAGYPHLYMPSCPQFAKRFTDQCRLFAKENEANKKKQRRNHMSEDRKNMKEQSEPELEKVTKRLNEYLEQICPPDQKAAAQAKKRWKQIAKPLFSLGKLEDAVTKIAGMKGSPAYSLDKKGLVIMCADNGVVEEGVTQTGQEVTAVVAENFTKSETSVCKMAQIAGVDLFPIDIGMVSDVPGVTKKEYKIAPGTKNMTREAAMTRTEAIRAILTGIEIVGMLKSKSNEILATGEMGIGNTTTSSAVASVLTDIPVKLMTGRGAGLSADGLRRKIAAIERAISLHAPDRGDPIDIISKVGGFDIAGLTGVFLGGAIFRIPIVIDGFISSVAALCAARLVPDCIGYMLPSHCSGEPAASKVLDELGLSALLDCGMSLGEGSGAVAVMPLLEMGLSVYKSMSTFEEIRVEQYEELK